MPNYEHKCTDENCGHEWEEFYSIKADPPKVCPECKLETAMRLISGGSGKGIVELTGHDLKDKIKSDVQGMKHRMRNDENYRANLVGEDRFHRDHH